MATHVVDWRLVFDCKTVEKAQKQLLKLEEVSNLHFTVEFIGKYHTGGFDIRAKTQIEANDKRIVPFEVLKQANKIALIWYTHITIFQDNNFDFQGTAAKTETSNPFQVPGLEFVGFGVFVG